MTPRGNWVYVMLAAVWAVVLAWQWGEHRRVGEGARQSLISRGRDITSTLGIVIRSERRWGGLVSKERMESALRDLLQRGDLRSITLLNTNGESVVTAGRADLDEAAQHAAAGVTWQGDNLVLANLVDLGVTPGSETNQQRQAIVVADFPTAPPFGPDSGTARASRSQTEDEPGRVAAPSVTNAPNPRPFRDRNRGRGGRPPWMSEEEYRNLIAKQGLHSFVIVLPTDSVREAVAADLRLRFMIAALAAAACAGLGLAWGNVLRSADLEIRLAKAGEMNSQLKQLNVAAAGLAHETRNPLNIIRGLAQLIVRERAAPSEILERASAIVEESDRVTAQLNEFINYSRPREVRLGPVRLSAVTADVARALAFDIEEKKARLAMACDDLVVEADEPLLRQTLFNLLLNALQAIGEGGEIEVRVSRTNGHAAMEIQDDGPGVPDDRKQDIFRPYFTTHREGTGLGLAVVKQIVAAHGWDIECTDRKPRGAIFRISHLKALARG
ncbi:MAG: hypothetical protein FJ404_05230 [Verrucomicrobia bacterium]|nr:hypothetical protein [Verrucomicrobiota bacterium]